MTTTNMMDEVEGSDPGGMDSEDIVTTVRVAAGRQQGVHHQESAFERGPMKKPPSSYSAHSTNLAGTRPAVGGALDQPRNAPAKGSLTSRRRQSSAVEAKMPMGPRPLDYGSGKRSASNSIVQQPFNGLRGASAVASQDPYTNQLSLNDISRFSFGSINTKLPPQDDSEDPLGFGNFLEPTFNFDEFHDNLSSTEPSLNHFPLPGGTGAIQVPQTQDGPTKQQDKLTTPAAIPIPPRKPAGSVILTRKGSTASSNASRISVKSDQALPTTNSILKGRRQSHFPPNAFNNPSGKAPRKSIGPGTFVAPDGLEQPVPKRTPSIGNRRSNNEGQASSLSSRMINRGSESGTDGSSSTRTIKAKSFLAPTKQKPKDLLTPSRTPDPPRAPSTNTQSTPNRRSGTPGRATGNSGSSTANRRMSVMPHHATGLGARTVSPTDARRMKRMSTVPPAPPLPQNRISQAPPTPQPETLTPVRPRSTAQSPAASNRKSLTPSSSRTTPDPNRKSYSSGQSLSSNTSYNSAPNTGPISVRLSQNLNSSRLPTPKPRVDTSNVTNMEAEVPPVPAIPKAFESPGSEIDQPFFSARSSSLPPVDTPISSSPLVTTIADAMKTLETPRAPSSSSRISAGIQTDTESRPKGQTNPNKRNVQSLRLPPLNLLPLSTPTTTKIKSFKDSKAESSSIPSTPPPAARNNMKTPSTPMTASKASFFSRSHRGVEEVQIMRSNTSHNAHPSEDRRPPSTSSPSLPPFSFETEPESARNISPFVSTSLPKSNGEFANYMRPNFTTELNRTTIQPKPNGPRAPSFSVTPKAEGAQTLAASPAGSDFSLTPSGMSGDLGRKRSETNPSEAASQDVDMSKYDNMPPPKLPASASWTNQLTTRSSPVQKATSYLRSRRQTSGSSTQTGPERQGSFDSAMTHVSIPSVDSIRSIAIHANRSGSVSSLGPGVNNNKSGHLRPQEPALDRDDMIAEEEMKKLASKRKDFESAARELDGLRARARPVQRMSATTATKLHDLNIFERGEIVDFLDVYFTGTRSARKIVGDLTPGSSNFGYDDERGDYNIVEGDHLAYRYEVVDLLGKGSFGQVVRCIDHKTGILVAVKIIRNKKRFHQQALVEVKILQKLREWDPTKKYSVVNFDQSFYFRGHLCISTDLLGMNLYEFIKAHDFRGFSLKLIRRFTKQLLNSLTLLQNHKVIHCDLKPENILLAHPVHSEIKVIDFGSSCFENEKVYTYIQSRFYRSPEVILGMSYGMPIDMWSVGCILAELFTGYPIFPGENEQEQLACIMEVFGPPEKHLIEKSTRRKLFFDSMGKPRLTVSSKGRRRRPSSKDLRQVLKCDDEAFLDFIAKCLRWDPSKRMNPQEAIKHEFITGMKMNTNPVRRNLTGATNSPVKRVNSVNTPGGARPLPQPPPTILKVGMGARQDASGPSPIKGGGPRRQSNVNTFQANLQAKRASHAAMTHTGSTSASNRLTIGQRTISNRSDLATAAAAASLVK